MKVAKKVFMCKKCGLISDDKLISHTWTGGMIKNFVPCSGKMVKRKMSDIFPWLREDQRRKV